MSMTRALCIGQQRARAVTLAHPGQQQGMVHA
jgi:hypothetical protein